MWYKRFGKFTLAGEGELPKTFLTPEMHPKAKSSTDLDIGPQGRRPISASQSLSFQPSFF
jgi:hypothetical protein